MGIAFVNKMDRIGADFYKVLDMIKDRLSANPVPVVLPIGAGDMFNGLIDLIRMEAILYTADDGSTFEYGEIPDDMKEDADKLSVDFESIGEINFFHKSPKGADK